MNSHPASNQSVNSELFPTTTCGEPGQCQQAQRGRRRLGDDSGKHVAATVTEVILTGAFEGEVRIQIDTAGGIQSSGSRGGITKIQSIHTGQLYRRRSCP